MNHITKIIIGISAIIALALLAFAVFSKPKNSDPPNTETPGQIELLPNFGSTPIYVNDFIKSSPRYDTSVVLHADSDYTIQYDSVKQNFQITFSLATLEQVRSMRLVAETKLIEKLGAEKDEACALSIEEVIPQTEFLDVTPNRFPMSFCPGGSYFPSNDQ